MNLLDLCVGADIRWYVRSTSRRFDSEIEEWSEDNEDRFEIDFDGRFSTYVRDSQSPRWLITVDGSLELANKNVDVFLRSTVMFVLDAPDSEIDWDAIHGFLEQHAVDYLVGILRGELISQTRASGIQALLIPPFPQKMVTDTANEISARMKEAYFETQD